MNNLTIQKDYSNKNLPFVNKNSSSTSSSVIKKDSSNKNIPYVNKNIGSATKTEYSSKTFVNKSTGNRTYNFNIQNIINQANINKNEVEKEPTDSVKREKKKDESAATKTTTDEIIR